MRCIFFAFAASICLSLLCSCQAEVDENLGADNNPAGTSRKVKGIVINDTSQQWNESFSFRYDSLNHRMEIFDDHPSVLNNTLDSLKYIYQFNAAGYLTEIKESQNNQMVPMYTIARNSNNEIQLITNYYFLNGTPFLTYYGYTQLAGGGIRVMDSSLTGMGTSQVRWSEYNSSGKILSIWEQGPTGVLHDRFFYDNQGRLTKITSPRDSLDFTYGGFTQPPGWANFRQQLVGKDGHILFKQPGHAVLHALDGALPNNHGTKDFKLFSEPPASIRQRGLGPWPSTTYYDQTVQFQYLYNADQSLKKIIMAGPLGTVTYDFFY